MAISRQNSNLFDRVKKLVPSVKAEAIMALEQVMVANSINTSLRANHFLAQLIHESGLKPIVENLNYSAEGLMKTWPTRFKTLIFANDYARNPTKIANSVYANRMGNGDEASGDGWRYRGRGYIQLTGKESYQKCGSAIGHDLVNDPDFLTTPEGAAKSAGWEWTIKKCNAKADLDDILAVTKAINGGTIGLESRKSWYAKLSAMV